MTKREEEVKNADADISYIECVLEISLGELYVNSH